MLNLEVVVEYINICDTHYTSMNNELRRRRSHSFGDIHTYITMGRRGMEEALWGAYALGVERVSCNEWLGGVSQDPLKQHIDNEGPLVRGMIGGTEGIVPRGHCYTAMLTQTELKCTTNM